MIKLFALPLLGLVSVIVGLLIQKYSLWSGITNISIPWVCSVLGIIFMLLGLHELFSLKEKRIWTHWLLFAGVSAVSFIAVIADSSGYAPGSIRTIDNMWFNLLEVLGLVVLYAVVLFGLYGGKKTE